VRAKRYWFYIPPGTGEFSVTINNITGKQVKLIGNSDGIGTFTMSFDNSRG
jgi:hypothetical protein